MTKEVPTNISAEDMLVIKESRSNMAMAAMQLENVTQAKRSAELQHQNILLSVYVKYGLTPEHSLDETSGRIMTREEALAQAKAAQEAQAQAQAVPVPQAAPETPAEPEPEPVAETKEG